MNKAFTMLAVSAAVLALVGAGVADISGVLDAAELEAAAAGKTR